ncbi:ELM1/GtrOC1 family putative glycosyltransferase [Methylopila henanensis]|uniref:ELM1/GtrOC1 family putative glycosyltransferase n=1 Tax=Methylopila henanensis TaxID=873516 RepID=A0ABW4K2U2_9HYPH
MNQCLAFCERAGWRADQIVQIVSPGRMTPPLKRIGLKLRRRIDTWRATPAAREAGPLRIVASGAAAERVVAAYRSLYGEHLFAAFSGRPSWSAPIFDVALVPRHSLKPGEQESGFGLPAAKRSILRRGVPVRRAPASSDAPQGVFAMIGGVNKAFEIDPDRIVAQIERLLENGAPPPFTVAFSRRTPAGVESWLRAALGDRVFFVDRRDRAGFETALVGAAEYVVTPDSLTMLCEACDTGKPVRVFDLVCFDPGSTTARCVQDLLDGGEVALAPDGEPTPPPAGCFEASGAAVEIYEQWEARRLQQA